MPTNKILTDFVINKVESQAVYDQMVANNLINDDEIYLVGGEANDTTVLYTPQELTDEQKAQVITNINAASRTDIDTINNVLNEYALNINYDTLFAFDTTEIVIDINTSSILGQAILGQMVLA